MPDTPSKPRAIRPIWALIVLCLLLLGLYEGVLWMVRVHVDQLIAGTHGRTLSKLELKDIAGKTHSIEELLGKTVLLHLVRSKCKSCIDEREAIVAFEGALDPERQMLVTVLVDPVMGYSEEETRGTIERLAFTHPMWIGDDRLLDALHGSRWARVTPITYVLDPTGKIVRSLRGVQTLDSLRDAIR